MTEPAELALLVETELRLDAAVASVREAAREAHEAACARARATELELEHHIAGERARIATVIATETKVREHAITAHAREAIARYDAVAEQRLERLAFVLARRLLAILQEHV